jgi:hypothetical protein
MLYVESIILFDLFLKMKEGTMYDDNNIVVPAISISKNKK